jgi:hypothetical protein
MGENPSNEKVLLFKGLGTGIFYLAGEFWPENRKSIYYVGSIFGFGAAAYNYQEFH